VVHHQQHEAHIQARALVSGEANVRRHQRSIDANTGRSEVSMWPIVGHLSCGDAGGHRIRHSFAALTRYRFADYFIVGAKLGCIPRQSDVTTSVVRRPHVVVASRGTMPFRSIGTLIDWYR
jgi:hypothetical protein